MSVNAPPQDSTTQGEERRRAQTTLLSPSVNVSAGAEEGADSLRSLAPQSTITIIYRHPTKGLLAFYYSAYETFGTLIASAVHDAGLSVATPYCLGIPSINLYLGKEFNTQQPKRLKFMQLLNFTAITAPFELCEETADMQFSSDLSALDSALADTRIIELVGSSYVNLLAQHKEAVDYERCVLAK